jgi:hypothetical protein
VHLQMLGLRIRLVALRTIVASPLASRCHFECSIHQLLARNTLDLGGRLCCGGQGSLPEGKGERRQAHLFPKFMQVSVSDRCHDCLSSRIPQGYEKSDYFGIWSMWKYTRRRVRRRAHSDSSLEAFDSYVLHLPSHKTTLLNTGSTDIAKS